MRRNRIPRTFALPVFALVGGTLLAGFSPAGTPATAPAAQPATRPVAAAGGADADVAALRQQVADLNKRLEKAEAQRDAAVAELKYLREAIESLGPNVPPALKPQQPWYRRVGTVRGRKTNHDEWAVVASLGAADGVKKGTRFHVVDPKEQSFLGYLTVDSVEEHESVGHLTGPQVEKVRAGCVLGTSDPKVAPTTAPADR